MMTTSMLTTTPTPSSAHSMITNGGSSRNRDAAGPATHRDRNSGCNDMNRNENNSKRNKMNNNSSCRRREKKNRNRGGSGSGSSGGGGGGDFRGGNQRQRHQQKNDNLKHRGLDRRASSAEPLHTIAEGKAGSYSELTVSSQHAKKPQTTPRRRRRGGRKNGKQHMHLQQEEPSMEKVRTANQMRKEECEDTKDVVEGMKKTKSKHRRGKRRNRKKYPWKVHVPPDTVDPISLDPIKSLDYPPFALAADAPYDVLSVWPPLMVSGSVGNSSVGDSERSGLFDTRDHESGEVNGGSDTGIGENMSDERKTGAAYDDEDSSPGDEYGGKSLSCVSGGVRNNPTKSNDPSDKSGGDRYAGECLSGVSGSGSNNPSKRYHLYDGRVLAYYLVSQLQFIDPLSRRYLTRDELLNLDTYLTRHNLGNAGVVEAYDSLALPKCAEGVGAQTARGRAEILQMEAASILTSLLHHGDHTRTTSLGGDRRQQRQESEIQKEAEHDSCPNGAMDFGNECRMQQMAQVNRSALSNAGSNDGTIAQEEGMNIIDNDENNGLHGGHSRLNLSYDIPTGGSASHVITRNVNGNGTNTEEFPSSLLIASTNDSNVQLKSNSSNSAVSSSVRAADTLPSDQRSWSFQRVGVVKNTEKDDSELHRRATEGARKRAASSQKSFDPPDSHAAVSPSNGDASFATGGAMEDLPSCGMLERNKVIAEALGVVPRRNMFSTSTVAKTGRARPTTMQELLDDCGNNVNCTDYSPYLLASAREYYHFVLRLEKTWKRFLVDDKSPCVTLSPMNEDLRKIVHEYANFWALDTESVDPEPRRYVRCSRLRYTSAPRQLLTEAVKYEGERSTFSIDASEKHLVKGAGRFAKPKLAVQNPPPDLSSSPTPASVAQGATLNQDDEYVSPPPSASTSSPSLIPTSSVKMATAHGAEYFKTKTLPAVGLRLCVAPKPGLHPTTVSRRFACDRQRPRLNLAPRTLPRELPVFDGVGRKQKKKSIWEEDRMRRIQSESRLEERRREEERKRRDASINAFESEGASDSESDCGRGDVGALFTHSDASVSSDWEIGKVEYDSSDNGGVR